MIIFEKKNEGIITSIHLVNTNLKMFFDMAKITNLNPISKRNWVKNELNAIYQ